MPSGKYISYYIIILLYLGEKTSLNYVCLFNFIFNHKKIIMYYKN